MSILLSQQSHRCCICENTFDYEDMTFCLLYQNPICSLCCSLDVHCGDKCREGATLAAQLTYFIDRFATPGVSKWLGRISPEYSVNPAVKRYFSQAAEPGVLADHRGFSWSSGCCCQR